jgi:hypothetical protein
MPGIMHRRAPETFFNSKTRKIAIYDIYCQPKPNKRAMMTLISLI